MAKTRRSPKASRKRPSASGKSPSGKAKRARKATRKSVRGAAASAAKPEKSVNLKEIRKQFALVLAGLSRKTGATPEVQARLDDTRQRVTQWMTDIDDICTPEEEEICGPTMVFPIP